MRARWWRDEGTFVVTWGSSHIVVGLTGMSRPSVAWHLRMVPNRIRMRLRVGGTSDGE